MTAVKSKLGRQKYWEVCEGACKSCWPRVKSHCPYKNQGEDSFIVKLQAEIETEEEQYLFGLIINQIKKVGYVLGRKFTQ